MGAFLFTASLVAVILLRGEEAFLCHLLCDQTAVPVGVLVAGDQEPAGAGVLHGQHLVPGVVGVGAFASIGPHHFGQAVDGIVGEYRLPAVTVSELCDVVIFVVLVADALSVGIDDGPQVVGFVVLIGHGLPGTVCGGL